jgi:alkylation response protein AidB-like acyl-CoA dehydrogenase
MPPPGGMPPAPAFFGSSATMASVVIKSAAMEAAIRIVNDALQMFGARGYSRDFPLERMARDVRMFTIGGGTAQVLRTLIASKVLGWKLPQTRDGYVVSKAKG